MAMMGNYCKAYPIARLREFGDWTDDLTDQPEPVEAPADEATTPEAETTPGSRYLFLQENFTVTDGIFLDKNIVFDKVTPEWIEFCKNTLQFEVPDYENMNTAGAQNASDATQ